MREEEYQFHLDVREKKVTGYSARKQRSHCGKSGRVRLPSDNLSKKELERMNGKCESYRLNDPMKWEEFIQMPDDIKAMYITLIRNKWNAPVAAIQEMMGVPRKPLRTVLDRLGLNPGRTGKVKWDKEGFWAWVHGVPVREAAEQETGQGTETEEDSRDESETIGVCEIVEEPKVAIPFCGNMDFEGETEKIMNTLLVLLGGAKINLHVAWEVCRDE